LFAKPNTIMPPNFVSVIPLNTELPIFVNASTTLSILRYGIQSYVPPIHKTTNINDDHCNCN
ncbi:hypothetical protein ALC62_15285, partial [Cyphomyrmex costatus]